MGSKCIMLLFLLISSSLFSSSVSAGRLHGEFAITQSTKASSDLQEASAREKAIASRGDKQEVKALHERILRANMRDYGRYDPAPTMNKPPFKLIPN